MFYKNRFFEGILNGDNWDHSYTEARHHSGRTDSVLGHTDVLNLSGLGNYHYHHTLGPHLHVGDKCVFPFIEVPTEVIKPLFQWLEDQVAYISTYTKNPRKIVDMIIGALSGFLQNVIASTNMLFAVLAVAMQYVTHLLRVRSADKCFQSIFAQLNDLHTTFAEKIDLERFTLYPDAFYLGKTIGDLLSLAIGLSTAGNGTDQFLESLGAGAARLVTATDITDISLICIAGRIERALDEVTEAAGSLSFVYCATANVDEDFDSYQREKEKKKPIVK